MKKRMYCLIFFLFLVNNCFKEFNFKNYKYEETIQFYLKKYKINEEVVLKIFNDIPLVYDIAKEDLFLIDKNDFLILFLEFISLNAHHEVFISLIDQIKSNFKDNSLVSFCDRVASVLSKKVEPLYEKIYFKKMSEYINYKKNNKDVDGLIFSAYCFLFEFSKFLQF